MKQQDKKKTEGMDTNSSFFYVIISSILSICFLIIVFAIISNLMKYMMAAKAMQTGDMGSAALIMSEGRPLQFGQPIQPMQSTGSLISVKL